MEKEQILTFNKTQSLEINNFKTTGNFVKIAQKLSEQAPFFLLFVMIIGMFTNDTQGILNISAALLFLFVVYTAATKKNNILSGLFRLISGRKFLFLFLAWCLFCATFFTYSGFTTDALKAIFDDWRYVIVITLFLIVFQSEQSKSQKVITYALISTLAFILFITPILKIIKGSDMPMYLQLRYGFAHYMTLLFPFTFSSIFLFKKKILKISMLFLSIMAFLFLLYTGSRGGILSISIEALLLLILLSDSYKKAFIRIFLLGIVTLLLTVISYLNIHQVKYKVDQSLYSKNITSGRDVLIEARLPIFSKELSNLFVGVGYGSVAYNQFLHDNNAKHVIGRFSEKKKSFVFHNDDPFFLNILYNIGLIGLILFIITFFINIRDLIRSIRIEKNILNIGLLASSIGYFLVYCLFEFIFLDIFILYNILTAILINNVLVKK
ncbi:O-antigen ligase family protein [Providencia sp. JUb39]|uniref:O-antigen ligase family protein n=1 Tax=Providencia sp. JUb39 TaxID=2724165 RepID=UPI00164D024A|nr:O-antigen ligase family protein [Providencia sp. JUb39]